MATRSTKPKCDGSTSQSCGMSCISRENTCREMVAADVATKLLAVAKQHQQPNDAAGQAFDSVAANFPPKLLKAAHKTGVASSDLDNGATLTTKVATGLDGSSIKYGFVTDADGKRYTVSDGLVKEVTAAAGAEWQEAFDAAVRSKVADSRAKDTKPPATVPKLPKGVTEGVTEYGNDVKRYVFKIGDHEVAMDFFSASDGTRDVDFKVNGSYKQTNTMTPAESARIAIILAKTMAYDVSKQPDGIAYTTAAVTFDGQGAKRTLAYIRIGFSRPEDGVAGLQQYGIVKDGKLTPDLDKVATKDTEVESVINANLDKLSVRRQTAKLNH